MRIVIDTNVLISISVFPTSITRAILRLLVEQHETVVPTYVAAEAQGVFKRKFPSKIEALAEFFDEVDPTFVAPSGPVPARLSIRDASDLPILHAALACDADIILSGDKDFGALEIERPAVMTMRQFHDTYVAPNHDR